MAANHLAGGRSTSLDQEILRALFRSNYQGAKDRVPTATKGTCGRFLNDPHFIDGKSVLAKTLVYGSFDNQGLPHSETTQYFFSNRISVDERSATNAVAVILHQLFLSKPALLEHALRLDGFKDGNRLGEILEPMWDILTALISDGEAGEIICVLGALDECIEEDRVQLIAALGRLLSNSRRPEINFKFMITSRSHKSFDQIFEELSTDMVKIDATSEEQMAYYDKMRYDPETTELLRQGLHSANHGTFLEVQLRLQADQCLAFATKASLQRIFEDMNKSLVEVYESIWDRSDDPEFVMPLFRLIIGAKRPFALTELNVAFVVEEGEKVYEDLKLHKDTSKFAGKIKSSCDTFVRIVDHTASLVHVSAGEFLISKPAAMDGAGARRQQMDTRDVNLLLARRCMLFLNFHRFEKYPIVPNRDETFEEIGVKVNAYIDNSIFLEHAATYWMHHRFQTWFSVCWYQLANIKLEVEASLTNTMKPPPQGLTDLMVASFLGLKVIGGTALHWSAEGGYVDVVALLLDQSAAISAKTCRGLTSLHKAAANGHETVVSLLLQKGVGVNMRDSNGDTPLHIAAYYGHPATVHTLLENGAEFVSSEEAKEQYKAVVRLLKAADFEASGLADDPSLISKRVDDLFKANVIRFRDGMVPPSVSSISLTDLFNEQDTPDKELFRWIHLPANNMRWVELLMHQHVKLKGGRPAQNAILKKELWAQRQHRVLTFPTDAMKKMIVVRVGTNEKGLKLYSCPLCTGEYDPGNLTWTFFILLKFLLNLLDDCKSRPSISCNLNQLPADDMKFLRNTFLTSHSWAVLQYRDTRLKGIEEAEFLKYLPPEGKTWKGLATDPAKIERRWGLSKDDLNIFLINLQKPIPETETPKLYQGTIQRVRNRFTKLCTRVNNTHPLHMRRTLDQSYYYMLDNTRPGDRDQVVSRYGKTLSRKHPVMIMVDSAYTVITSFPQRQGTSDDDPDPYGMMDVFQNKANAEAACYQRFTQSLESPNALDLSNIKEESQLLREVKDILDELNVMSIIFLEQQRIYHSFWEADGLRILEENMIKLNTMQDQASKTYESLKDLMDLRQKHPNLQEARSVRQ
ncbi:uncharacterized protein PAC_12153 [Phialocephala subalpina]|uniref:Nephrocystin 3-like N-terminal domain-containing protein n=1 Tax=Phialocephala subalpina TaxID=576137 RepID=A0A1L7XB88_9HELO|nr:uncharacterized protein PAC_12153 [Phialocephala subalpina]